MRSPKEILKGSIRLIVGGYSPYFIYCWSSEGSDEFAQLKRAFEIRRVSGIELVGSERLLEEHAGFFGDESLAFGCYSNGCLEGICFYWFGERYKLRGFWDLESNEAKLVHISVASTVRGRGMATELICASSRAMSNAGFSKLYARIWHSNAPSIRAFEKAGWSRIAFVLEVNPFRRKRPMRIQWRIARS